MTREMREMLQDLETMKAKVRSLLGENKVEEAEKQMAEVRALQKKITVQQELEAADYGGVDDGVPVPSAGGVDKDLNAEYKRIFLRALRRQNISAADYSIVREYQQKVVAVMHGGGASDAPDGDMGLVVPEDVQTRINGIQRELNDLSQYIRVETVNTASGTRVLEADADMTPLAVVGEYDNISKMDNPKLVPVRYTLAKRAGYLPITNELLADTDQNLLQYVTDWIARKYVVTKNVLITNLLQSLTPIPLESINDVKRVLNVDLDPAISLNSVIITNQDGYHWLDTQVDNTGRYLLQDDITQPGKKLFKGRRIVVVSNRYLPSIEGETTQVPMFIGNGGQFAVLFTRGLYELAATKEGGTAWRQDATELRVITRDDLQQWDAGAMVYGQLTIG